MKDLRGGHAGGEGKDAPVSVFPAGRIRGLGEGGSKVNRAAASPPMGVHPRRDSTERLRIVTGGVDPLPRRNTLEPPWFGDCGEVPPGDHSRANKGICIPKGQVSQLFSQSMIFLEPLEVGRSLCSENRKSPSAVRPKCRNWGIFP